MHKSNVLSVSRWLPGLLVSGLVALTVSEWVMAAEKSLPVPRHGDGRVMISGEPDDAVGLWVPDYRNSPPSFNFEEVQFKPWARGLYDARQTHDLEPHARCKPSGAVRQLLTPYGVEILDMPQLKRLYIFDIGGPHTYREVYMDGRSHPADLEPSYYGHSIGWWEGDTLVIDSVGYNTGFWFERRGLPHTEAAHVIEYFTRTSKDSMDYRFVLADPQTYENAVEGTVRLNWHGDQELFEYICQQSNYASDLMVNQDGEVIGGTSPITP